MAVGDGTEAPAEVLTNPDETAQPVIEQIVSEAQVTLTLSPAMTQAMANEVPSGMSPNLVACALTAWPEGSFVSADQAVEAAVQKAEPVQQELTLINNFVNFNAAEIQSGQPPASASTGDAATDASIAALDQQLQGLLGDLAKAMPALQALSSQTASSGDWSTATVWQPNDMKGLGQFSATTMTVYRWPAVKRFVQQVNAMIARFIVLSNKIRALRLRVKKAKRTKIAVKKISGLDDVMMTRNLLIAGGAGVLLWCLLRKRR